MNTQIPHEAFQEILEELRRRPLAENHYRDIAGAGRSQTFGIVNRRCLPIDYSRQNWIRPKLYYHLKEFADKYVDISYTSITVNQGYRCKPHRDRGNQGVSYLVAFGSYSGGELRIHEGDMSGVHDVWCKPIKADFSKMLHSVEDFSGERNSLVFYTLKPTRMPETPLPPATIGCENGKYIFKRDGVALTRKNGLPHPLKGRKKDPTIVKESGGFVVSFE